MRIRSCDRNHSEAVAIALTKRCQSERSCAAYSADETHRRHAILQPISLDACGSSNAICVGLPEFGRNAMVQ